MVTALLPCRSTDPPGGNPPGPESRPGFFGYIYTNIRPGPGQRAGRSSRPRLACPLIGPGAVAIVRPCCLLDP